MDVDRAIEHLKELQSQLPTDDAKSAELENVLRCLLWTTHPIRMEPWLGRTTSDDGGVW